MFSIMCVIVAIVSFVLGSVSVWFVASKLFSKALACERKARKYVELDLECERNILRYAELACECAQKARKEAEEALACEKNEHIATMQRLEWNSQEYATIFYLYRSKVDDARERSSKMCRAIDYAYVGGLISQDLAAQMKFDSNSTQKLAPLAKTDEESN